MRKTPAKGRNKAADKLKLRIAEYEKQKNSTSIPSKIRDSLRRPGSMKGHRR